MRPYFRSRSCFAVATYLAVVSALAASTGTRVSASELDTLHSQILQNPGNVELNLRFGQLAESEGKLRWALAAYERAVLSDPNNAEALSALTRVKRALQPDTTLLTVQLGTQFESNPRYYLPPRRGEIQVLGSAALLDERKLGGTRWRTDGVVAGLVHGRESDLTYGVVGAETGPVLDAMPGWTLHPAVGGGAAYFDHRFYYSEGSASATLNSSTLGLYRSLSVRGAYRSYDEFFPSGNGFYVEARGKLAVPNVIGAGSVIIVSPWAVWSDISGTASVVTPVITELQPGAYVEWGGRLDLIKSLTNWLVLGVNVAASQRDYRNDIVITTGSKRATRS